MASGRGLGELFRSSKRPALAALFALFLINVASYADRSILVVLQEPIKADLGLSDFQLGLLAGPAFAIFYGVMGLPIARLAERISRKKIILVAVSAWSLFTALCGMATNFVQLALCRMSVGAAEAGSPPATHSMIADMFPRTSRGKAMAFLTLGIPVGLMLGGLAGGTIASLGGWRVAFVAVGLPGLLLALVGSWLLYEPKRELGHIRPGEERLGFWPSIRLLWAHPVFRLLLVIAVLSGNASHAVSTFAASFFMRTHGLTIAEAGGILITGKGLAGMAGTILGGVLSDQLDKRGRGQDYLLVPAMGAIMACFLLWLSYGASDVVIAMSLFIAAALFANMIVSPAFAAVQNVADPRVRATAAALFLFCVTVLGAAGPPMVGYLSDVVGAASLDMSRSAYLASCPGGAAAAGAPAALVEGCPQAAMTGLQSGVSVALFLYAATFIVYLFAVRAGRKVEAASQSGVASD